MQHVKMAAMFLDVTAKFSPLTLSLHCWNLAGTPESCKDSTGVWKTGQRLASTAISEDNRIVPAKCRKKLGDCRPLLYC